MASTANMMIRVLGDVTDAKKKLRELDENIARMEADTAMRMGSINNGFTKFGGTLKTLGSGMQQVGAKLTMGLTVPLTLLAGAAMKVAVDFEAAFAGVRKTVEAPAGVDSDAYFAELRQALIDLSNELGTPKEDLAMIMQLAGQLGIRGPGALKNFTNAVARLNITTGIAPEQLAQLLGKFAAITGLDVESEIDNLSNVITALGNNAATTENDILKFGIRMAAAGRLIGMTPAQILAIGAASESTGTKAERGGSAMTKIFMAMQSEVSGAYIQTAEFQKIVNENGAEMVTATQKLNDARIALDQYTKSGQTDTEMLKELQGALASAQSEYDMLADVQEDLGLMAKLANNEQGGFAKMLGLTSSEFATLMKQEGGSALVFQRFVDQIYEAKEAGKDVGAMLKELGLGDVRLMTAVQSLSEANNEGADSLNALAELLGIAESAWIGYGGALGATDEEVRKRLDTTKAQMDIFRELWKSIALVFTDDANGALKELLKTVNATLGKFLDWLKTLDSIKVGVNEAGNPISQLDVLVKSVGKSLLFLIGLGPGLSIAGGFISSFGTAFQGLGTALDFFKKSGDGIKKSSFVKKLGSMFGGKGGMPIGASSPWAMLVPEMFAPKPDEPNPLGDLEGISYKPSLIKEATKKSLYKWMGYGNYDSAPLVNGTAELNLPSKGKGAGLFWSRLGMPSTSLPTKAPWLTSMGGLIKNKQLPTEGLNAFEKSVVGTGRKFNSFTEGINKSMTKMHKIVVSKFIAMKMAAIEFGATAKASAAGQAAQAVGFQLAPLFAGFGKLGSILTKLLPLLKMGAMILGGWAVILAVVAAGLTLFFMSTGKGADEVGSIFLNLNNIVRNFETTVAGFLGNFIKTFPEFAKQFSETFSAVVSGITGLIIQVVDSFFDLVPLMLTAAGLLLGGMLQGFTEKLPELLQSGIDIIMAIVNGLWQALPSIIKFALDMVVALGNAIVDSIPALLTAVLQLGVQLMGFLWQVVTDGSLWNIGVQIVAGILEGLWSMLTNLLSEIGKFVWSMIKAFLGLFGIHSPSTVFAEIGGFLIMGLLEGIKTLWNSLMTFWKTLPSLLLGIFTGAGKWLYDIGKTVLTGMWDGLSWYWTNVFKVAFNISKWFIDIFAGAGKWLFDAGKNLIQGLMNGIGDWGAALASWLIKQLPSWLVDPVKWALGIKSPSRVFMGIGEMVGEGLMIGIDSMQAGVTESAEALANAALIDGELIDKAMTIDGKMVKDYSGLTQSFVDALGAVGLEVYMDGKKVTDVISTQLALDQRRT